MTQQLVVADEAIIATVLAAKEVAGEPLWASAMCLQVAFQLGPTTEGEVTFKSPASKLIVFLEMYPEVFVPA